MTAAPILSDAGYTMVSPSNTAPFLTEPATHEAGYLRVAWNDVDGPSVVAEFFRDRGAATSAVIVDGGLSSVTLGQAFVDSFESLGGSNLVTVTGDPDIEPGTPEAAELIEDVVAAGVPDVLYFPVFAPLGVAVIVEARAEPQLDDTDLATGDTLAFPELVDIVGVAAEGMFFGVPDPEFTNPDYLDRYVPAFVAKFGEDPPAFFNAHAFDATNMILDAVERVAVVTGDDDDDDDDDDDGNQGLDQAQTIHIGRQALRDTLFATDDLEGLTGTISCDPFGDCTATGFVIVTIENGEFVPVADDGHDDDGDDDD